ncbi:MAG: ATP-dependent Clp protease adapter ClpS [Verrucomicrobiota bacterium]
MSDYTLQDSPQAVPVLEPEVEKATPWNVIVMNDPVNLMNYVVYVFQTVFGYTKQKATRHMLEVHEQGKSLVWSGDFEKAEAFVYTLQQWQLTATLESAEGE